MAWKDKWEDCCGNCKHHKKDYEVDNEFVCMNKMSSCFGCFTEYSDGEGCPDFESKNS